MAFAILGTPKPAFFDSSGSPLAAGTLEVRNPADDTSKLTYPTATDADALTNPNGANITLDSRGEPDGVEFWGVDGEDYKLTLKDEFGATIWTVDNIDLDFAGESVGRSLWPTTAAETAAGITPSDYSYQPGDVRRYGVVPNSTAARTTNTTALVNLFDPTTTGPVGDFWFPNTTGADTYYLDGIIELREGCHLDLMECTLDFTKTSYVSADDLMGFFTFIQDNSIQNGTISVDYDGSAGTNAGLIMRIGSRNGYPFGSYTGGIDDEDLTDPMGSIVLRNLRLTSNNPGPTSMVLMLGGLENVIIENIVLNGQDVIEDGFYYEYGFYHYEVTVANITSSHARNMHFMNIKANDMKDDDTFGYVVSLVGAYNCSVDGVVADVSYGVFLQRPGEALFYNVGAPYATNLQRSNRVRNITGANLTGTLISNGGSESASGGYLSGEGLSEAQQVDLLHLDVSDFTMQSGNIGLVSTGPITAHNGSIKNATAEGMRLSDECVDFSFDRIEILDGATAGIRANFGGNIFTTERKKVGTLTNCFIAGNANNAIDIDHTESVFIAYNRIGYTTAHDGAAETTQNIGVSVGTDGDGVVCEGNTVAISGGSNAYQITGTPRDCMIKNPKGVVTQSGVWGVDGIHASETNTNLLDVAATVNTSNKYTGKLVRNSSTSKMFRASGPLAADTWVSFDAVTTLSPV